MAYRLFHSGAEADVLVLNPQNAELQSLMPVKKAPDTSKLLRSPMPGLVVSIIVEGKPCAGVVAELNAKGIRTHVRKADYFSGNILEPLGRPTCIRVSMCHYNTAEEVLCFLREIEAISQFQTIF